jgi:glutamate-1-semialdehyde 2,1-aminomutase
MNNKNYQLWNKAKKIILGGNSLFSKRPEIFLPNKWPVYYKKAKGCYIWDLNGIKYTDLALMGVGTSILGYANNLVDNAVIKSLHKSNMSSLNCTEEVDLAKELLKIHPWASKVKFARTGAEANSIAVRVARAHTKSSKIAVCGYHGWHDWYLSAMLNKNNEISKFLLNGLNHKGIPKELKNLTYTFKYNDIKKLEYLLKVKKIRIIKMEVVRNIQPLDNFLQKVRQLANKYKAVLIFDECTSGFRAVLGGIHKQFKITPDIVVYGKAIGNGYAITTVIGKKNIMNSAEDSFISSTFWSERSGPTAALKTLEIMEKTKSYEIITRQGKIIKKIWKSLSSKYNVPIEITGLDSICSFSFLNKDSEILKTIFISEMLKQRFLANTTVFVSVAHTKKILKNYKNAMDKTFKIISNFDKKKLTKFKKLKPAHKGFYRLN